MPMRLIFCALLVGACSHEAPAPRAERTSGSEARDRAEAREADREAAPAPATTSTAEAPTAADQSNDERDLEITQSIRNAVVNDASLSLAARNVSIITRSAVVTLRGDVDSAAERERIEAYAWHTDRVIRVENLLNVN